MIAGRRFTLSSLAAVTALVLLPTAASAANRYASPTGSALDACADSTAPCSIDRAVNLANPGDDVTLLGGVAPAAPYSAAVSLIIPANTTVHGAPGARPVVNFSTAATDDGFFVGNGATLRDVVASSSSAQTVLVDAIGGTVERVSAHSSGTSDNNYTCVGGSHAVFRDSVCWFSGPADISQATNSAFAAFSQETGDTVVLRNLTIVAQNANGLNALAGNGHSMTVTATNVIARGGTTDVKASDFGGTTAAAVLNLDHSNYATRLAAPNGTITDPSTGANQTAAPVFLDAANGDFHENSASTGTIDLGTSTGLLGGELDADGLARTVGSAPDIGAFEFVPAPPSAGGTPTTAAPTPKRKKCKKKKHRAAVSKKCKKRK